MKLGQVLEVYTCTCMQVTFLYRNQSGSPTSSRNTPNVARSPTTECLSCHVTVAIINRQLHSSINSDVVMLMTINAAKLSRLVEFHASSVFCNRLHDTQINLVF